MMTNRHTQVCVVVLATRAIPMFDCQRLIHLNYTINKVKAYDNLEDNTSKTEIIEIIVSIATRHNYFSTKL